MPCRIDHRYIQHLGAVEVVHLSWGWLASGTYSGHRCPIVGLPGKCACTSVPVGLLLVQLPHSPVLCVARHRGCGFLREPLWAPPLAGRPGQALSRGRLSETPPPPPLHFFPTHRLSDSPKETTILPQLTPAVQLLARNGTQAQSRRSSSTWFVPSPSVTTVASGTSSAGFAVLLIPPPATPSPTPWPWPWPARARAVLLLPPPPAQPSPINSPTPTPLPIHSQCPPHVAVNYLWSCTGEPPQW